MSFLTTIYLLCAIILLCSALNLLAQGLLLTLKMGYTWKEAIIPFASNIKLYKRLGMNTPNIVGIALRLGGVIIAITTLIAQYYFAQVAMTHIYGILLGYYQYTDYSTLWMILSYGSIIIIAGGIAARLICVRKFAKMFGVSGLMNLVGMFFPGIYMLILAFSKKYTYLLNKPVGKMSREEYDIYCAFAEE